MGIEAIFATRKYDRVEKLIKSSPAPYRIELSGGC